MCIRDRGGGGIGNGIIRRYRIGSSVFGEAFPADGADVGQDVEFSRIFCQGMRDAVSYTHLDVYKRQMFLPVHFFHFGFMVAVHKEWTTVLAGHCKKGRDMIKNSS